MYNPYLDTFIAVADAGSFSKASEKLFISSTAIMKQMNSLEEHLNLKLIERKSNGIALTPAGNVIYKEAKTIKEYSVMAIAKANAETERYETTFCVGTSLLNPAKPFMDLWYKMGNEFSNYRIHLVPFEDNHEGITSEIKLLGEKFDFLIGVNDSKTWNEICDFKKLGTYKKMIAVPRKHRLANKKKLKLEDLNGETLMMVPRGDSGVNDEIRDFITNNYPKIKIVDTSLHYDHEVFSKCAESNNVLLTIECWKDVHPGLITLPIDWDYKIPYGLLYAKDAPEDVRQFVKDVDKIK